MNERVDTPDQLATVGATIRSLIDEGEAAAAVSFADCLEGADVPVTHLRAYTYTEAGEALRDRSLVSRGAALWRSLEGKTLDWPYNLGNAELSLFEIAVSGDGRAAAFERERQHLHQARSCFSRAAAETSLLDDIRLQALTNLGNSYSQMGRDLEAIEHWRKAFEIDSEFAMAHANVGVALQSVAAFMGPHVATVIHDAAAELDHALSRREEIARYGGPGSVARFEAIRAKLPKDPKPHRHDATRWSDPHLQWCRAHELFLHVSHPCLREDVRILDPLFFRSLTGGIDDESQERVERLFDAYNALKQGYVSARYLTWLGTDPDAETRENIDTIRGRIGFFDTSLNARFGLRTGIALQAFTAATNVLDQVASFLHLYFETGRQPTSISFRRLWRGAGGKLDPKLATWLDDERFNRGLYALCDLAADLEHDSLLDRLIDRRHALTHRFFVVHDVLADPVQDERLERLDWPTFVDESVKQLRIARAALIYLARAVDSAERVKSRGRDGFQVELPVLELDPSLSEFA